MPTSGLVGRVGPVLLGEAGARDIRVWRGSEGYRSLRVLHHVTAEAAGGGAERFLRSELELEEFAADSGAAVVCAYRRGPWDAALPDKPRCVHPRSDALGRRKWGRRCLSRPWVPAPGRCGPGARAPACRPADPIRAWPAVVVRCPVCRRFGAESLLGARRGEGSEHGRAGSPYGTGVDRACPAVSPPGPSRAASPGVKQ
ncbi:MEDS domain-containing protein [Streptomyces nigra]|uniref:MEDS domain-containing protein n=1 Tax=Streptomyces nigra TaxID=1827580 RepID=UPI0036B456E9